MKNFLDFFETKIDSVLIDLTNICNYRCRFCWYHLDPNVQFLRTFREPFFFPASKLIEFIKDLDSMYVNNLTITSEGEPTLYPEIDKIIRYLDKTKIYTKIQTNGTYDEKLRRTMLLLNEIHFNISFFSKTVFSKLNPRVEFLNAKVIDNINFIKSQKEKPKIIVIYIINKYNISEIDTIVERLNKLGIDEVKFKICEIIYSINEDLMLSRNEARTVAVKLIKQIKHCKFKNNIIEITRNLMKDYYGKLFFKNNPKIKNLNFCWTDWKKKAPDISKCESDYILRSPDLKACFNSLRYLYLRLNGDVYFCARNSWIDPIGNIFDNNIIEILNCANYKRLAKESIFNFDINKPKWMRCKNCPEAEFQRKMLNNIKRNNPVIYKRITYSLKTQNPISIEKLRVR